MFLEQLRQLRSAHVAKLHCRVVAGGGGEIDRAGGVQRASQGPAIEGAHFEIAVMQREIGGSVGDFDLTQAQMSDTDGAVEQRPILAAGADAVDEILHHAFVLALKRGRERAEVDRCGGEIEASLAGGGAGQRRAQASGEARGAEGGGDAVPAQLGGRYCRRGGGNMDGFGEVRGLEVGIVQANGAADVGERCCLIDDSGRGAASRPAR